MSSPYLCPNCKSNRMRFNIIQQVPRAVCLDPQSGAVMEELSHDQLDPFHQPYRGEPYLVQCGICGVVEREESFIKMAQHRQKQ
ncbi:MAG: hypothetical protein H0Z34_05630 [Brevibacillus sp.]|nr:hypothetical protein [Brevibacillus sp.]